MTQDEALKNILQGHNVFITGSPGTGKSYLLEQIRDILYNSGYTVATTASTGIASVQIGGETIHSWSGIKITPEHKVTIDVIRDIATNPFVKKKLANTDVLIIDEVSMLHAYQIDMVHQVCQYARRSDRPFGGIQVILCGDFFQLPPVSGYNLSIPKYAFESKIWLDMQPRVCYLSKVYRQQDETFIQYLLNIRENVNMEETYYYFNQRINIPANLAYGLKPVILYSTNKDVDRINNDNLANLPGNGITYEMQFFGKDKFLLDMLTKFCLSPQLLTLKINTPVLFTRNNKKEGYYNGMSGMVVDIDSETGCPMVIIPSGRVITVGRETWELTTSHVKQNIKAKDDNMVSIRQIPLKLAWAITIHKSQGMTLTGATIDLRDVFEYGMGYVALSRVQTYDTINLLGLRKDSLDVSPLIITMDKTFKQLSKIYEQKIADNVMNEW